MRGLRHYGEAFHNLSSFDKNAIDPIEGIETRWSRSTNSWRKCLYKNAIDPIEGIETYLPDLVYSTIFSMYKNAIDPIEGIETICALTMSTIRIFNIIRMPLTRLRGLRLYSVS